MRLTRAMAAQLLVWDAQELEVCRGVEERVSRKQYLSSELRCTLEYAMAPSVRCEDKPDVVVRVECLEACQVTPLGSEDTTDPASNLKLWLCKG